MSERTACIPIGTHYIMQRVRETLISRHFETDLLRELNDNTC